MTIKITPTFLALLALTIVSLISARLASSNPALSTLNTPLLYAALTLLYFFSYHLTQKIKPPIRTSLTILAVVALLVNLGYTIYRLYRVPTGTLPLQTAIAVAKPTLLGVGPGNFVDAFTQHKPPSFNISPVWNQRFYLSRNEPLQILTTLGILGLLAYLALLISVVISIFTHPRSILLLVVIILQFILPPSHINFSLFIFLLSLIPSTSLVSFTLPPLALTVILVPAFFAGIIWFNQIYLAESYFKQALQAVEDNRGTDSYNLHIKAIRKNRHEPRYRTSYAAINLSLAIAFSQKKEISGGDREKIVTLVQQAIREAKVAVNLNPHRTQSWETLASIYRQLIGVAEGADKWAISSLTQAISTDPHNPALYLQLGGLHYSLKNYPDAAKFFSQAMVLKPNWPNAHYNLAAAYKQQGQLNQAIQSLNDTLDLLDPASADYTKATTELQVLTDKIAASETATSSGELSLPTPIPTPPPNFQVPLSPDLAP